MHTMPVLSVVGLNIENSTKNYIKQLMNDVLSKKNLIISIRIIPEPTNIFDSNAIKVMFNEFPVGFIAKSDQHFFNFQHYTEYTGHIISWGIMKDSSVYVYVQPIGVLKIG